MNRYPHCPPWCGDHSDNGSDLHRSAHDRIPLGVHEHGFVASYAAREDDKAPSAAVNAVVYHDPRIDVVLWIHDPEKARDLALLIEWLDHATPGQHRVLAAQIRDAAKVVTENEGMLPIGDYFREAYAALRKARKEVESIPDRMTAGGLLTDLADCFVRLAAIERALLPRAVAVDMATPDWGDDE